MENTYTYTARSANDPTRVVTFTLIDDSMLVDVGPPIEQVERALSTGEDNDDEAEGHTRIRPWLKPATTSILERIAGAFHVDDVDASAKNSSLRVMAWARIRGLRLAPVIFDMRHVDNPDAAQAFVKEVAKRRETTESHRGIVGPLDYWATWALGGLFVGIALRGRSRSRQRSDHK